MSKLLRSKLIFKVPAYQLLRGDCFYPEVNETWFTATSLLPDMQNMKRFSTFFLFFFSTLFFFFPVMKQKGTSISWNKVGGIVILKAVMKQAFTDIKQFSSRHR